MANGSIDKGKLFVPDSAAELAAELYRLTGEGDVGAISAELVVNTRKVLIGAAFVATLGNLLDALDGMSDRRDGNARGAETKSASLLPDLEVLPGGEVLAATSKLFFNHHWSNDVIHGPDMMFSCAPLVEIFLAPGEKVTAMNVRFQAAVFKELKMFAGCADRFAVPKPYIDEKPDVVADFETNQGRCIKFCAFQTDKKVRHNICGNLGARDIADGFGDGWELDTVGGKEVRVFDLADLGPEFRAKFNELKESVPLGTQLNTAMELVLYAMSALNKSNRSVVPKAPWHLAGSFTDFRPPALKDLGVSTKLEIFVDLKGIKDNGKGFKFLPIEFAFKNRGKVIGSGTYVDAYPAGDDLADDWCARNLG